MIAPDSKSYPFLALALHNNLPYGTVLLYADAYRKLRTMYQFNRHEIIAIKTMKSIERERGGDFQNQIMKLVDVRSNISDYSKT